MTGQKPDTAKVMFAAGSLMLLIPIVAFLLILFAVVVYAAIG